MNSSYDALVPILIIGGTFAIGFIDLLFLWYLANWRLEEFEGHLKNCEWVTGNASMLGKVGVWGKFYRLNTISVILEAPYYWDKKGFVCLDEILRFPPRSRLLIRAGYYVLTGVCLNMFFIWFWIEFFSEGG